MAEELIDLAEPDRLLRYLPPHLRRRYQEGLEDAELLQLRQEIALLDVRIKLLVQNLDWEEMDEEKVADELRERFPTVPEETIPDLARHITDLLPTNYIDHRTFKRLARLVDDIHDHERDRRLTKAAAAQTQLFNEIQAGKRLGDVWDTLETTMEKRRRLVESEQKRLHTANQSVAIDRVVTLLGFAIGALREAVLRNVLDKSLQEAILNHAEATWSSQLANSFDLETDALLVDGDAE